METSWLVHVMYINWEVNSVLKREGTGACTKNKKARFFHTIIIETIVFLQSQGLKKPYYYNNVLCFNTVYTYVLRMYNNQAMECALFSRIIKKKS